MSEHSNKERDLILRELDLDGLLESNESESETESDPGTEKNFLDGLFPSPKSSPSSPSRGKKMNHQSNQTQAFSLSPGPKPYGMNSVHMEVQENAKIPNAYHIPVRRAPETDTRCDPIFVDEVIRLSDADIELTEWFLGSDHRMSKAAAYSNAGLLSSIGTKVAAMGSGFNDHYKDDHVVNNKNEHDSNKPSADDLNDAKVVSGSDEASVVGGSSMTNHSTAIALPDRTADTSTRTAQTPVSSHASTTRAYYGRSIPLPIPTRGIVAPQHLPVDLISTTKAPQNHTVLQSQPNSSTQLNTVSKAACTTSIATTSCRAPIVTSIPNAPGQPSIPLSALPPVHVAPSILEATKKRSQFGFGGNHKIPSIPQPPVPKEGSRQMSGNSFVGKKPDVPLVSSSMKAADGTSYERKKQRAKDARVKLNESIERLSVAINVAGTQSKERMKTQRGLANPIKRGGTTVPPKGLGGTVINGVLSIMEQVSRTSDDAKKWDRPSFVGTAASVVQHLNAECEALMREVVQLKKERLQWVDPNNGSCHCGKRKFANGPFALGNSISDSGSFDDAEKGQQDGRARKKRKEQELEEETNVYNIYQYERITNTIGKFLDPRSLIRATSVSTSWRFQLSCFQSDNIWSPLCYNRFGSIQVRDVQDQISEDVLLQQHHPHDTRNRTIMMNLYRRMNASNIKPKCHYEGSLHLGGGRIKNVVSAWASLVERSNGETRRSVMAVGTGGEIKYASLPVVELRIMIQNTGMGDGIISVPEQIISIDASTKRSSGVEMFEITSDDRFKKILLNINGTSRNKPSPIGNGINDLAGLGLFDSVLIYAYIHAKSCPTTSKVKAKAKYVKVLVNIRGITLPLVIPFSN